MNTETEDELLDNIEAESERRSIREARINAMRRNKKRQQFLRTYWKHILAGSVILACVIAVTAAVHIHDTNAADEDIATETGGRNITDEDTGSPVTEQISGETDITEDAESTDDDKKDDYVDSEYGPYAEVYSEEKELFFDGYKVTGFETASYPSEDDVKSTYAVLIDADDGTVIASKDGNTRIYPASMTKIMTVLVAAEHVTDLDDRFMIDISITDYAYSHDCSAVGFSLGESVTVRDLMYGTILPSGADAAVALAEYVAGSEDRFVDMMNDKLEELGLSDSAHFTNCVGIYNDDHYCTLSDMAMIMKAAVENDLAREIMNAHIYTTSRTSDHPDGIEISNWFLRRIEDKDTNGEVICAKTGFVAQSGCCGASYERSASGKHYICVTADAWSSWRCIYDHVALYSAYTE